MSGQTVRREKSWRGKRVERARRELGALLRKQLRQFSYPEQLRRIQAAIDLFREHGI